MCNIFSENIRTKQNMYIKKTETWGNPLQKKSGHMAPTVGFLRAERVLQILRGVRGQDDATETGRRATPQTIVDIVKNRTLK